MRIIRILRAAMIGLAVLGPLGLAGPPAGAQILRVVEGSTATVLRVPMNRAVVVESEVLFAELSVANPQIADIATLSERSIYVLGRAPGRTTLTLLGPDGGLIANVEVQVSPDVAEFRERLQEILPGEPIEVRTANDGIVLSGVVSSGQVLDRALVLAERYAPGRVSNMMHVGGTQQVMLRVRFAEMSRTVRQELGVSLGLANESGDYGGTAGVNTTGPTTFGLGAATPGGNNGALGVSFGSSSLQFSILLEALETEGVVRTLAEPNLSALSGQTASFLAGGEFPVPVEGENGAVTVQFQPFGVELEFTPTVVTEDIINLQLAATVSAIDAETAGFNGVPGLRTREASTVVEMRDGESFAIAGLLQDDFRDSIGQVPWLGDLPVIGALFRSANYQREQTELVIIVTAHLVTPTRGEALVLPTDRVRVPTERELFLGGETAVPMTGPEADVAQQDFSGSYGYVME